MRHTDLDQLHLLLGRGAETPRPTKAFQPDQRTGPSRGSFGRAGSRPGPSQLCIPVAPWCLSLCVWCQVCISVCVCPCVCLPVHTYICSGDKGRTLARRGHHQAGVRVPWAGHGTPTAPVPCLTATPHSLYFSLGSGTVHTCPSPCLSSLGLCACSSLLVKSPWFLHSWKILLFIIRVQRPRNIQYGEDFPICYHSPTPAPGSLPSSGTSNCNCQLHDCVAPNYKLGAPSGLS